MRVYVVKGWLTIDANIEDLRDKQREFIDALQSVFSEQLLEEFEVVFDNDRVTILHSGDNVVPFEGLKELDSMGFNVKDIYENGFDGDNFWLEIIVELPRA